MIFSFVFSIDENIIKVYYYKKIELFYQNFVDIVLEHSWYIDQSKKHHLILKIAVTDLEGYFLFISFFDLYLIISIG